jgi:hypothetical protein
MTVTDTTPIEADAGELEALELIDKGLAIASNRSLVSADEVTDLLLDIRRAITR